MTPEVTSDRLHAVAAELFAEHGYDSTSVRMIADALGIKAGSLYYHMESKETLLFDVINRALDRLIEGVLPTMNSQLKPSMKLWCALHIHIRIGCATRNQMIVTVREPDKLSPEHYAMVTSKRRSYEALYESIVGDGIETGEFYEFDKRLASYLFLGMANWACQMYRATGALSIDEYASICVRMLFGGLSRSEEWRAETVPQSTDVVSN